MSRITERAKISLMKEDVAYWVMWLRSATKEAHLHRWMTDKH